MYSVYELDIKPDNVTAGCVVLIEVPSFAREFMFVLL